MVVTFFPSSRAVPLWPVLRLRGRGAEESRGGEVRACLTALIEVYLCCVVYASYDAFSQCRVVCLFWQVVPHYLLPIYMGSIIMCSPTKAFLYIWEALSCVVPLKPFYVYGKTELNSVIFYKPPISLLLCSLAWCSQSCRIFWHQGNVNCQLVQHLTT